MTTVDRLDHLLLHMVMLLLLLCVANAEILVMDWLVSGAEVLRRGRVVVIHGMEVMIRPRSAAIIVRVVRF